MLLFHCGGNTYIWKKVIVCKTCSTNIVIFYCRLHKF